MADKEALEFVEEELQKRIKSFDERRKLYRRAGQTHTKVHISISANFERLIENGLINQDLLRKRLTALAL